MGLLNLKSLGEECGEMTIFMLVEMQNGTGTMETSMESSKKIIKRTTIWPSSPASVYSQEFKVDLEEVFVSPRS